MANKKAQREPKRFWLSYDLGIRGDYADLYEWLDSKDAKECGDSVSTFLSDKTRDELESEIKKVLGKSSRARLYLISPDTGGKWLGKFLMGKRKSAPWAGFSEAATDVALDQ